MEDHVRLAVGLPIGEEAEFFVGGLGYCGQERDPSIMEFNNPPKTQPGLWNHWIPQKDSNGLYTEIALRFILRVSESFSK